MSDCPIGCCTLSDPHDVSVHGPDSCHARLARLHGENIRLRDNETNSATVSDHGNTDVVWTIEVFREDDGRFAADFRSGDKRVGGMGEYSATPIGALAELCSTLIKIAEDESIERREASSPESLRP